MIEGIVNAAREAVVSLTLQGPSGQTARVDAVVDTGFSFYLTVPTALARDLDLTPTGSNRVMLADGSETTLDVYTVSVLWDGRPRGIPAYAADATPLAGMALLERHSLYVEVEEGGRVAIRARP